MLINITDYFVLLDNTLYTPIVSDSPTIKRSRKPSQHDAFGDSLMSAFKHWITKA